MLTTQSKYRGTGLQWLESLPASWKILRTKQVFHLRSEKAPQNNNMELLSVYSKIGVKPRKDLEQRGNKASTTDGYWIVRRGDIICNKLLAWMGAIGVSHYEGVTSPAYDVLQPIQLCNADYYHYIFRTPIYLQQFKIRSRGIMDMRLRLYFDQLGQIPIPVPPVDKQNTIVAFLNWKSAQINKFISNKRRLIGLLKEQKQNIINQAIKRGINSDIKVKSSGVKWIGDIPEHWNVKRLRTLALIKSSGVDKKSHENEESVLLCNYVDVYKNHEITSAIEFMKATATLDEIKNFELKAGDILITKDSESWNDIAVPAYVPASLAGVVCAYHLAVVRTTSREINPEFLFYSFHTESIANQFRISANGVTRFGLSLGAIKDAYFIIPPIIEQINIVNHIKAESEKIEFTISRAKREIELIQEYRTRLISDITTGQIDVCNIVVPEITEYDLHEIDVDMNELGEEVEIEENIDEAD